MSEGKPWEQARERFVGALRTAMHAQMSGTEEEQQTYNREVEKAEAQLRGAVSFEIERLKQGIEEILETESLRHGLHARLSALLHPTEDEDGPA